VKIAARIGPLAEPGGVCVTRAVFEQIEKKVPQPCLPLSKPELKDSLSKTEVYKLVLEASPESLQAAASSRKQLMWVVFGVVVLNLVLFLKFGLEHKSVSPAPGTNAATHMLETNRNQ